MWSSFFLHLVATSRQLKNILFRMVVVGEVGSVEKGKKWSIAPEGFVTVVSKCLRVLREG